MRLSHPSQAPPYPGDGREDDQASLAGTPAVVVPVGQVPCASPSHGVHDERAKYGLYAYEDDGRCDEDGRHSKENKGREVGLLSKSKSCRSLHGFQGQIVDEG